MIKAQKFFFNEIQINWKIKSNTGRIKSEKKEIIKKKYLQRKSLSYMLKLLL